jgi:hypothetical protein
MDDTPADFVDKVHKLVDKIAEAFGAVNPCALIAFTSG